jgi:hypothetical protein
MTDSSKRRDARLIPETRLGLRLLRRVRRVWVHFARNQLARFACLGGVEFFIRGTTDKGHNSTDEESEKPSFHSEINNRRILDFQRRCKP